MSVVTSVILILDYPNEPYLSEINKFTGNSANEELNTDGYKCLETDVYLGAYNYFNEDAFIEYLNTIEWDGNRRDCVIMESNDKQLMKIWRPLNQNDR